MVKKVLKRLNTSNKWSIDKSIKYTSVPRGSLRIDQSLSLLTILRDYLKLVRTKKELLKAINELKRISLCGKKKLEYNTSVGLFDYIFIKNDLEEKIFTIVLSANNKIICQEVLKPLYWLRVSKVLKINHFQSRIHFKNNRTYILDNRTCQLERLAIKPLDTIIFEDMTYSKILKVFKPSPNQSGYVFKGALSTKNIILKEITRSKDHFVISCDNELIKIKNLENIIWGLNSFRDSLKNTISFEIKGLIDD